MGTRKQTEQQEEIWVPRASLPVGRGHPFYQRWNGLLDEHGFDAFVEKRHWNQRSWLVRLEGFEPPACCSGGSSIPFHPFSISHLFFVFLPIGVSALARKLTPLPSIDRFLVHF